jgi:signal transduction histidine kinase/DNA-binding response OmpR family regulator
MDDKVNILVVDDLPHKLLAFQVVLEELGQNLVLANSGAQALRELLERDFAVILLDVNMPDIDGIETAELIRQHPKTAHTPIIFITAYADEMQTARGYALGAVDYILSPIVPEILRSKVKVFVDLFRAQRRAQALARAEADKAAAHDAQRRSEFLALASRELGASLDLEEGMERLLGMVVPALGDFAMLVVDVEREHLIHWRNANGLACPYPNLDSLPPPLLAGLENADGHARPVDLPIRNAPAPWPSEIRAARVLPLLAGERSVGSLVLGAAAEEFKLSGADVGMVNELASRAAIAFENSRLYRSLKLEMARSKEAEEKLQEASRRKDEFLAMLSHELRNPLAPIRNAAEVMRRVARADGGVAWACEVVERQVTHLAQLVDDLLDVSRITQGKITLKKEPVELGKVIAHSVETARTLLEAKRHQLHVEMPSTAAWVHGDFARLAQIMDNLLNNAAKYTPEGGTVRVVASVDRGEVIVRVRDNGIGIEPHVLPHVFDLFMQGDPTLDRGQGGLGVGLTVVQRLVELHQGRVAVESEGLGHGAEFRVALPCISEVATDKATPVEPAQPKASASGRRVLVVDDNADAAESIAVFLRLEGHEVKTVSDGLQVLECMQVFAPQVAVVDIGLPGMNGYDVARRLRANRATAPALLIALTGYGQSEDFARSQAAGFDHHFVKPADPRTIQAVIAGWVGPSAGTQQPAQAQPTG